MCVGDDEAQEGYFCTVFGFKMNILIAVDDGWKLMIARLHTVSAAAAAAAAVYVLSLLLPKPPYALHLRRRD